MKVEGHKMKTANIWEFQSFNISSVIIYGLLFAIQWMILELVL